MPSPTREWTSRVNRIEDFVTPDNLDRMFAGTIDYVIDAIDQVRTKAAMIGWCKLHDLPLITAGGAGGQIDPTQIQIADLNKTFNDPLASRVRSTLRRDQRSQRSGLTVPRAMIVVSR